MVLKDFEIQAAIDVYEKGKSSCTAVKELKEIYNIIISKASIHRIWYRAGYKLQDPGGKREKNNHKHLEDKKIILAAYNRYEGNASLASKSLPYSHNKINKVWRIAGLRGLESKI